MYVKKLLIVSLFIAVMTNYVVAMKIEKNPMDLRKMGLQFSCNAQNESGNTFWHNLAHGSEYFNSWNSFEKEMDHITNSYRELDKGRHILFNVFITNNMGRTARQEAKMLFKKSYNPVTGAYILYLKNAEKELIKQCIGL